MTTALNPLNIGTIPGDGTGDVPRAGFSKLKADNLKWLSTVGRRATATGTYGTTTSVGTATTLNDAGPTWAVNQFAGQTLTFITGALAGWSTTVTSNTANTITFPALTGAAAGIAVASGVGYQVTGLASNAGSEGLATIVGGTSPSTLIDSTQAWTVNAWAGYYVTLLGGAFAGQQVPIISNTATALTFAVTLGSAIAAGTPYLIGSAPIAPEKWITAAEIAASVTPADYRYGPGNVLRYGADITGATDSSTAWNNAIAQRQQKGVKVWVPSGLYKINITITGQNVEIEGESSWYEDQNTVGLIANNTAIPVIQIGDGTTTTNSIGLTKIKMHGQGTAAQGLYILGANNVYLDRVIARGFTTFCERITASTTNSTTYVFHGRCNFAANASAASIGVDIVQPANYPTSYTTAVYYDQCRLGAATGCLWTLQIDNNTTVGMTDCYLQLPNNAGVHLIGLASRINCANVSFDSNSGTDVTVTMGANASVNTNIQGTYNTAGLATMPAGVTTDPIKIGGTYRQFLGAPSVQGSMDFQDSSATLNNQSKNATQIATIYRGGNNFWLTNSAGAIITASAGPLEIVNGTATGDGYILYGITGITIKTGANSPEAVVTAPVGSLFLRSNGVIGGSIYYKATGTGNTGWIAVGGLMNVSVTATMAATVDDYTPTGWTAGSTNRLILTPATGGSTFNGLNSTGVPDGFTVLIQNASASDPITVTHLAGTSLAANQFSNVNASPVYIAPLGAARATLVVNKWQFS